VGENIRTDLIIGFEVVELNGSELGSVTIWKEQSEKTSWSIKQGIFLTKCRSIT
jgi:ribosomal 30S subunit maturation factor RimM